MPSLPTSDGFKNPVCSSGLCSKICNPTSQLLDRSVSAPASLHSHKPCQAENIDPRAVKSLNSPAEHQITPEKRECPLLLQNLSDCASSTNSDHALQTGAISCHSPTIPSQQMFKKPVALDSLKKSSADEKGHGLGSLTEVAREGGLPDATKKPGQQAVLDVPLPSEHLELNEMNELPLELQTHTDPEVECLLSNQNKLVDPEQSCRIDGLELPAGGEQDLTHIQADSPVERRGKGLENIGFSCGKETSPMSLTCSCSCTETFTEIDVVEQPLITLDSLSNKQTTDANDIDVSGQNLDYPLMEIESSKHDSLSVISSHPVSTSDLPQPEINVDITGISTELSNILAENSAPFSLSHSGIHQLNTNPSTSTEESCASLASALKELHELLVISRKGDSNALLPENDIVFQPKNVPEEQIEIKELYKDEQEHMDPESQVLNGPFPNVSEPMNVQIPIGVEPCAAECLANDQVPANQILEQNKLLSLEFTLDEDDALRDAQTLLTGSPATTSSSQLEALRPPCGLVEPLLSPPIRSPELSSTAPLPPVFLAADIDRILSAGFPLQEAIEALEQAGGNADLALLILLAKNIVVPT